MAFSLTHNLFYIDHFGQYFCSKVRCPSSSIPSHPLPSSPPLLPRLNFYCSFLLHMAYSLAQAYLRARDLLPCTAYPLALHSTLLPCSLPPGGTLHLFVLSLSCFHELSFYYSLRPSLLCCARPSPSRAAFSLAHGLLLHAWAFISLQRYLAPRPPLSFPSPLSLFALSLPLSLPYPLPLPLSPSPPLPLSPSLAS